MVFPAQQQLNKAFPNKTEEEWSEYHKQRIEELPKGMREKAIQIIQSDFYGEELDRIKLIAKTNTNWFLKYQYTLGLSIQARLARYGLMQSNTPSKSWADYWVPLVEIALGVRERPKDLDSLKRK